MLLPPAKPPRGKATIEPRASGPSRPMVGQPVGQVCPWLHNRRPKPARGRVASRSSRPMVGRPIGQPALGRTASEPSRPGVKAKNNIIFLNHEFYDQASMPTANPGFESDALKD